jgi:hypothetical protein
MTTIRLCSGPGWLTLLAVASSAWDIAGNDDTGDDNGFPLKALCRGDGAAVGTRAGSWSVRWCRYLHPTNLSVRGVLSSVCVLMTQSNLPGSCFFSFLFFSWLYPSTDIVLYFSVILIKTHRSSKEKKSKTNRKGKIALPKTCVEIQVSIFFPPDRPVIDSFERYGWIYYEYKNAKTKTTIRTIHTTTSIRIRWSPRQLINTWPSC